MINRSTDRPTCLDLFCGAGGASMGLSQAGYEVTGIDNNPKRAKRYPFTFICADALKPPVRLEGFDLIWASPPCQRYTTVFRGQEHRRLLHADLLGPTRDLKLDAASVPYVIENVPGAPIRADVVLTGAVFGLEIVRKRLFEISGFPPPFTLLQEHFRKTVSNGDLATVAGKGANNAWNVRRKASKRKGKAIRWRDLPEDLKTRLKQRNNAAGWRAAMDIDWMTRDEIREAVPPSYARFIGQAARQCLEHAL